MKTFTAILASIALVLTSAAADDANAKKAADLFAKSVKAGGGVAAAKSIKSRIMTGTMNMNQMGDWKMVITAKAPNSRHSAAYSARI